MAQKRMFSKDVVRTDAFLDMPLSSQALYFHLNLDADVKGFVSPRVIMRMVNSTADDLNVLITKGFVIPFESGVIVITHWHINNAIRETHEAESQFPKELARLELLQQGKYQLQEYYSSTTAQISIDEIRLDKINNNVENKKNNLSIYMEKYNELFKTKARPTEDRRRKLNTRLKSYTLDEILQALTALSKSPFHKGNNENNWIANPDFLIRSDSKVDEWLQKATKEEIRLKPNQYINPNGEIAEKPKLTKSEVYDTSGMRTNLAKKFKL